LNRKAVALQFKITRSDDDKEVRLLVIGCGLSAILGLRAGWLLR